MKKCNVRRFMVAVSVVGLLVVSGCGFTKTGSQDVEPIDTDENEQVEPVTDDVVEDVVDEVTVDTLEDTAEIVTVADVVRGDTVEVVTEDGTTETVRLLFVETPEPSTQMFGDEARTLAMYALLDVSDDVTIYLERGTSDDSYGFLWMDSDSFGSKPVNFSKLLLEQGLARIMEEHESNVPNKEHLDELYQAEQRAKDERLNVWYDTGYVTEDGFDMSMGVE